MAGFAGGEDAGAEEGDSTPVMYEELAEIEKQFDDIEVEIIRKQNTLTTPIYAKRAALISRIPNFWPLVLEQAPPDIDTYIQPSDSELLGSLKDLHVERFEITPGPAVGAHGPTSLGTNGTDGKGGGDPRSILIRFEFEPNEYCTDLVIEKRFWYRRALDGWAGLVSEPVRIQWKEGRDLTEGLGDAAVAFWEAEKKTKAEADRAGKRVNRKEKRKELAEFTHLVQKLKSSTPGSLSFFAWFGFRGRDVSAEESAEAVRKEAERRSRIKNGKQIPIDLDDDEEDLKEEDESDDEAYEIFPQGDELAISITEDLYPGAIKYFTQAQEQDNLSEADFEDSNDDDDDNDGNGVGGMAAEALRDLVQQEGNGDEDEDEDDNGQGKGEEEGDDIGDERPRKRVRI